MKLEVLVTLTEQEAVHLRCEGECIRIGRDPTVECTIPESHARGVSWLHARMEVSSGLLTYTDLGSSYGSYLNGNLERLTQPAQVNVGDKVQLGLNDAGVTGPVLKILSYDLGDANREPASPLKLSANRLQWGLIVTSLSLLTITGCFILWRATARPEPMAVASTPASTSTEQPRRSLEMEPKKSPENTPRTTVANDRPPSIKTEFPTEKKGSRSNDSSLSEKESAADFAQNPIGAYVAIPETLPSILLQKKKEGYPWTPLRANSDQVLTNTTLMSMPGSYSILQLDYGMEVDLWGSLPALSRFPVILESVVQFQNSQSKSVPEISLVRGRIRLVNKLKDGATSIRLSFQNEKWTVVLHTPSSEVVVELWHLPQESNVGSTHPVAMAVLGLFSSGKVGVSTSNQQFELDGVSQVTWMGSGQLLKQPEVKKLATPPDWLERGKLRNSLQVEAIKPALLDWAMLLNRYENEVADMVRMCLNERQEPAIQEVGVYYLAALDQPAKLLEYLRNDNPILRGVAADCLRSWLQRSRMNVRILEKCLEDASYATDKKDKIIKLLGRFPDAELKKPGTYQELISLLDHEDSEIRQLALWHLAHFFPQESKEAGFNPKGVPDDRMKAVRIWKTLVPPSRIPFK